MTMLKSTIVIAILFLAGCAKDVAFKSNCTAFMLKEYNMKPYIGQEIDCKYFLMLYHYQNKQFFLLGNHCVDMTSYPLDCGGNNLCEEDADCKDFYDNAKNIGIIGIDK